jgi:cbb3-type cytochrome oxidase subunit 3
MDINDLRSAVTVAGLLLFTLLTVWIWLPRRREAWRDAADLPFVGDGEPGRPNEGGDRHE